MNQNVNQNEIMIRNKAHPEFETGEANLNLYRNVVVEWMMDNKLKLNPSTDSLRLTIPKFLLLSEIIVK